MWGANLAPRALHDQPVAHGVLGHHVRLDELPQVIRAAGLAPRSRQTVATERLATHHRPGDASVHVQVADGGAPPDIADNPGIAREQAAGQGVRKAVDDVAGVLDAGYAVDGEQRPEDLLVQDGRVTRQVDDDGG